MGTKREAELKAAFIRELLVQCPDFRVMRLLDAGAPDRLIVGAGRASFLEFKHGTPSYRSTGQQDLFCARLAVTMYCRFVFWLETAQGTGRKTLIVHPRNVLEGKLDPEAWCHGFNHKWLVEQVKKAHRL